ncbi:ABC-ATPase domain-containing protein [Aquibacillus sp. 3ASR75-11]|uniref:ABC-ATPase domain-containing protein n=1 Tax=Terrihalobacillus insolitus TaxID=2950438 RepID=A0A9X3WRV6_9BACI|nr:ABC-ATPase domain-containing protein [Terrihalobacillus insolitus]MDC3413633.1 ABC-ATPase domain-containing protein [Terrihalobacillus insolitus]MDC3424610.1 ABC-ATPase domain-containing protein [Terrihalobacillus insolitus]
MKVLQRKLQQIDGKSYKAYKSIQGRYSFHQYELIIDYVQGDPFASPSKIRIIVPDAYRKIEKDWKKDKYRKVYVEDKLARSVALAIHKNNIYTKGSGKSGMIAIDAPGQEILERTAVTLDPEHITVCLSIGLPANGRKINGKEAEKLFFSALPSILENSIYSIKDETLEKAAQLADQQQSIRQKMKENNWIAFIADGAILPRESGVSNRPLEEAIAFKSPAENRVSITIPHRTEPITGMALEKGIVLIVGGGYHGKSTLLNAIERGVYHHIHGDGREFVLTDPNAVKVRAEDGRQVTAVNISPFINDLPHKQDTNHFTTENASGSTSQAANVVEALEVGATTILIDEDTSATNFMIRDQRMQKLVANEKEPITPFIDKIDQLKKDLDVSTILVMGGSGDYFDVADQVIMMDNYEPHNVTDKAKEITKKLSYQRDVSQTKSFGVLPNRQFHPESFQTTKGKKTKVQAKGRTTILMGRTDISLQYVEQLVDASQTQMIAEMIRFLDQQGTLKKGYALADLLDEIEEQIDQQGLGSFARFPSQHPGDLARPRRFEIAATLNRLRTAKVKDLSS